MKNLKNKRAVKMKVKDLRKALKGEDGEKDVVLAFYMKDKGIHFGYLSEVATEMKYDSVSKTRLSDSSVVELVCFNDKYTTYVEREDDSE